MYYSSYGDGHGWATSETKLHFGELRDTLNHYWDTAVTKDSVAYTVDTTTTLDSTNIIANGLSLPSDIATFTKAELAARTSDVADYAEADGDVWTGVHDFGGATSLEMPNGTNPTTDAIGEYAWDSDDSAVEFYTGSVSALMPVLKKMEALIWNPDLITDTVPIFFVDSTIYQGGIEIVHAEIQASADGAYTLEIIEFSAADPPVSEGAIGGLAIAAADQRADTTTFTDATIAVGNTVAINTPAIDIDWIRVSIRYYVKENN
jgi:hypothetical protein